MSAMWKYHPPSPMMRPIPMTELSSSEVMKQPYQLPFEISLACETVFGERPAIERRLR